MRILVLAPQPFFKERGTPIAVRMLVETLADTGYHVDLLVYHEGQDVSLSGAELHRIPSLPFVRNISPGFSIKKVVCDGFMVFKALQMIVKGRYDLIHAVEESAFIARALQWLSQTPYVYDMDSSMPQQILDKYEFAEAIECIMDALERWVINGSAATVVVCRSLEERVRRVSINKPILRLEDVSLLQETEVDEDLRRDYAVDGPMVMYVGNLESYQGIDLLLDSFGLLQAQVCNAHLMIIGGSKEHVQKYKQYVTTRDLQRHVHFAGPRPLAHLGAYLQQADILVSPRSQGENTPMKIYSYLDSGRPVVATRRRTHTQVLDDEIAMLAEPAPKAMADAMHQLIRDRALQKRLVANASDRVAQEFSPAAFRRKLTDFYEMIERDVLAFDEREETESFVTAE